MARVKLKCENCGKEFEREKKEHSRNQKIGRRTFCSRSCNGKQTNSHLEKYRGKFTKHLPKGRGCDNLSPWREHIKRIRNRCKKKDWDLEVTCEDLQRLWEKQKGKCAYTGKQMYSPQSTTEYQNNKVEPHWVSVDRIDSDKPYTLSNIHLVCLSINLAKQNFTHEQMIKFLN